MLPDPALPRRTIHSVIRNDVIREYGWGTERTAPAVLDGPTRGRTAMADFRTGRTAFGTKAPEDTS